jgi:hypothetical protein
MIHTSIPCRGDTHHLYVSCITIIDTITLTNYTNDAYTYDTYTPHTSQGGHTHHLGEGDEGDRYVTCITIIDTIITIIDTIILHIHTNDAYTYPYPILFYDI